MLRQVSSLVESVLLDKVTLTKKRNVHVSVFSILGRVLIVLLCTVMLFRSCPS